MVSHDENMFGFLLLFLGVMEINLSWDLEAKKRSESDSYLNHWGCDNKFTCLIHLYISMTYSGTLKD